MKYSQRTIWVDEDDYTKLKLMLVKQKKSVSQWVREKILEEITK